MLTTFNEQRGTLTLTADNSREKSIINFLRIHRTKGDFLRYNGRFGAGPSASHLEPMFLIFKISWLEKFTLRASTVYHEEHVRHIRDSMRVSAGKLFILPDVLCDRSSIAVCATFCQFCRKPLIQCTESTMETCRWCIHKHPELCGDSEDNCLGLNDKIATLPQ